MIDPISALSIAASAVSSAKTLLAAGRDASGALSKFAGAVSDVNYAAEKARNPSIFASLTGSAEQAAIDAFSAQKRLQAMKKEIETIIMFQHGPKGLEEYKDTLRKIRAQRKKTAYRKAEIKEALIMWVVGGIIVLAGVAGLAATLWAIGKQQGKWQMKDAEIIRLFDQNVELIIEGLAARSGRDFSEILALLRDRGIRYAK